MAVDLSTTRYLVTLVLSSVVFLGLTLQSQSKNERLVVSILLVTATFFNILTTYKDTSPAYIAAGASIGSNIANSDDFALINAVQKLDLTKGYGDYWNGNINTYLTDGKISFLPASCSQNGLSKYTWLVDDSQFSRPAKRSFYIIDPEHIPTCSLQQLTQQFGPPTETVHVLDKTIVVYNYDITSRLVQ